MSLLDAVEPDGWHYDCDEDLYVRSKVESLLAECRKEARKEALLDAVQVIERNSIPYENTAITSADELRRMAEGENDEIHN